MSDQLNSPVADAQRRQLTILFCDLIGSTELSTHLELEEVHALLQRYLRCCADCIEAAGGFVARYMGDGVLAYFGYPLAHENAPERAISAALSICQAAPGLMPGDSEPLAVRCGIATGVVVVGDLLGAGPAQERSVVGATPNLAARLQAIAGANQVVVSDLTRQLAAGRFEFDPLAPGPLKGFSSQEQAWRVVGPRLAAERFDARRDLGLSRFVGRETEIDAIMHRWREREATGGQVIGLYGRAGIGKSRLLHESRRAIARGPHLWLEGAGAQIFENTPFHAIILMIRRWLSRKAPSTTDTPFARLARALEAACVTTEHALPLIAELIGLSTPNAQPPLTASAEERRELLLEALTEWLLRTAERWPVVMAVEDLHWADPSTLELLDRIVGREASPPLLLLYTARSPFKPPWPSTPRHLQLDLAGLESEGMRRLVLSGAGQGLPAEMLDSVVARAEGIPLFAEELARLLAGQDGSMRDRTIPSKLSDLLTARLDQLGPEKHLAQTAAVLGVEFDAPLLRAISGQVPNDFDSSIERLLGADIIVPLDQPSQDGRATYRFRHSLIRDTAYDMLLRSQRRALHHRAATVICMDLPELAQTRPEVLAHHWTGAGETARALTAWRDAGRMASDRKAYHEAQHAYVEAVAAIETLPESAERDQQELELQSALGNVLQITRGYSAAPAISAFGRARQLADKGGDRGQRFAQLAGQWMAASSAGEYAMACQAADQLFILARVGDSQEELATAHMIQMTSLYRVGHLLQAEAVFLDGQVYFDAPEFRRWPGAATQTFGNAAVNAWIQGRPEIARPRIQKMLDLGRSNPNPYERAFALYMAGMQAVMFAELREAETYAEQALEISLEHSFPQFIATSKIVLGRARAEREGKAEAIALINDGLEAMKSTRSKAGLTMYLTWLAEAYLSAGEDALAEAALDRALRENPQERFYRPETFRLRAAVRRRQSRQEAAALDWREAVTLAKAMGARTFHARALEDREAYERAETV